MKPRIRKEGGLWRLYGDPPSYDPANNPFIWATAWDFQGIKSAWFILTEKVRAGLL